MVYNPDISLIQDMSDQINKAKSGYDIVKASEAEYERQRANNRANFIKNAVESAYGRGLDTISAQSFETISGASNDNFVGNLVMTNPSATSLIPPRAVGPLEEIPVGTIFGGDGIALRNIVTQTKVKAEHVLESKLAMNKVWKKGGVFGEFGASRLIKNKYTKDNPMTIEEYDPRDPKALFSFSITNPAHGAGGTTENFPAYISNYSENISASWDSIHFVNSIEDRYIYQKSDRSFTLEFILFVNAQDSVSYEQSTLKSLEGIGNGGEVIPPLKSYEVVTWEIFQSYLEFLNKIVRPRINSDGIITEVPICYMSIGNHLVDEQICIFEGVTLNYDPMIWDLGIDSTGYGKPMFIQATLTGKYLHNNPSTSNDFYKGLA